MLSKFKAENIKQYLLIIVWMCLMSYFDYFKFIAFSFQMYTGLSINSYIIYRKNIAIPRSEENDRAWILHSSAAQAPWKYLWMLYQEHFS